MNANPPSNPVPFSIRSILVLTTLVAAILIPAKLFLTHPEFRMVAWWCGIVATGYLVFGLLGWRILPQARLEIDQTRRQIIAEQTAKKNSEEDTTKESAD